MDLLFGVFLWGGGGGERWGWRSFYFFCVCVCSLKGQSTSVDVMDPSFEGNIFDFLLSFFFFFFLCLWQKIFFNHNANDALNQVSLFFI